MPRCRRWAGLWQVDQQQPHLQLAQTTFAARHSHCIALLPVLTALLPPRYPWGPSNDFCGALLGPGDSLGHLCAWATITMAS